MLSMRREHVALVVLMGLLVGTIGAVPRAPQVARESPESVLRQARRLADELLEKVRQLLLSELEKGGYEGAVRVCSEIAQEIPREIEKRTGASIRRVSLRYRNPQDAPDEYEREKLEQFDRQNRERALPEESAEIVREGDREYLRYMRPILVGPMCITCHGPAEAIPSAVRAVLAEKYPEDRAMGYRSGDVRGAVSVKIPISRR